MEKRKHQRIDSLELPVQVSDGKSTSLGTMLNISRSGCCIINLPDMIDPRSSRLVLHVEGGETLFKMLAKPRWTRHESSGNQIGVEIVNAPWGWTDLIDNLETVRRGEQEGSTTTAATSLIGPSIKQRPN